MSRHVALALGVVLIACTLAACSDAGAGASAGGRTSAVPGSGGAARVVTSSIDATAPNDVISVLLRDDQLSRLATIMKGTGLTDLLAEDGPHTVFAPSDGAFEAMQPGLRQLAESGQLRWLSARLRYHVVAGDISPEMLERTKSLKSVTGETITVTATAGRIVLDGRATVLASHEASSGWVYRIDKVLQVPAR